MHAAAKAASMAERPTTAGAMSDMESWSDGSNGAGGVATELRKACGRGWGDGRDGQRLDETRRRDDGATGAGEVKAGMEDIVVQLFQGGHGRLGRRRCVQLILDNDAAGMKAERVDPQGEAALQAAVKAMYWMTLRQSFKDGVVWGWRECSSCAATCPASVFVFMSSWSQLLAPAKFDFDFDLSLLSDQRSKIKTFSREFALRSDFRIGSRPTNV